MFTYVRYVLFGRMFCLNLISKTFQEKEELLSETLINDYLECNVLTNAQQLLVINDILIKNIIITYREFDLDSKFILKVNQLMVM